MKARTSIYLDHNATTPVDERVVTAMADAYRNLPGNGASQHRWGRAARQALDDAADSIAACLGARTNRADADRWFFTSGGTEANNWILRGWASLIPGRMIVSAIEHPSILETAEYLETQGWQIDRLRVTTSGVVDLDHLTDLLGNHQPPPRLVSVMMANNETGVVQPVSEIVKMCQPLGIPVHSDAVQVVGKRPVQFTQSGLTAMTVTAHKLHGPCGVGGLLIKPATRLEPLLFGGAQQLGLRPGTEPVALAVGFETAVSLAHAELESRASQLAARRDQLERGLRDRLSNIVIHGESVDRLPHTSNISFPGLDRQSLLIQLDLAGLCCSTGSACASGSSKPSHVLLAMGLPDDWVESAIRFSLGIATTEEDIAEAIERIALVVQKGLGSLGKIR